MDNVPVRTAEAAVSFAVQKLGEALIQKVAFLMGVEEQLNGLKDELENMYGFLQDAAQKQVTNEGIRVWITRIRQVAQDVEDAIEAFNLKIDTPRRRRGRLENCACFPCHVNHLDKLGKEIESIHKRLKNIDNSRQRYGIRNLGDQGMVLTRRPAVDERRRLSPWQRDKHLVGLEEDVEMLLQRAILEESQGLSIATIVGIGGIGKSTLAKAVYNQSAVAGQFDRRAWVVVSDEFNPREVMKELVLQLLEPSEDELKMLEIMEKSPMEHLKSMLHNRLKGRRYFIVLDDVWKQEDWESLAPAFPDDEDKASRLLVTSRNNNVPRDARHVHNMKTLDDNKSWELFLNKAFAYDTKGNCPPELEEIGRQIVGKCGGLPLAITVVGGLLQEQRQSWNGWERVLIGIDSHLGRSESKVSAILELSYQNLPPQLKSCFLCLAFSKEDAAIRAEKLLHVWIAEGLISQLEGDDQDTVEEKARDYLDDLINRNMVQVKDITKDGRVKHCQIHDLLRELCIRKAKEEISFEILRNQGSNSRSLDQKSRHRAIYCTNLETFISSVGSTKANNKHTRSLFFHRVGNYDDDTTNDIDSPSYWKSFKLLRVLDFQRFHLTVLPEAIGSLSGLKYLGLRHNFIKKLPSSLGSLKNLEVLDIVGNNGVEVPNVIWKMDSLRHFYMFCIRCEVPLRIDTLKNLRTLIYIPLMGNNWSPEQLIQMTNLRILGICINTDRDVGELITSLAVLDNLECLKLWWYDIPKPSLDRLVSLHRVTQLKLWGPQARVPSAGNFPPNLSHLTLHMAGLRADPMPVLEKLTNLVYLRLSVNAYSGKEMSISHDGFPRLKVLLLYWLDNLTNIQFAGMGGMPEIKRFEMRKCPMLKSLPDELRLICKELKKAYL